MIMVSDHGMTYIGPGSGFQTILLDQFIEKDDVEVVVSNSGIFVYILTKPGRLEKVYNSLKAAKGADCYKNDEIPESYNLKGAKYLLDITCVAHDKFIMIGLQNTEINIPFTNSTSLSNGAHGFPPTVKDMRAIFFAKGPDFKSGIVADPIHMEDEYGIFAKLLRIPAQPNNGSWSRVEDMFVHKYEDSDEDEVKY